ncbi:glycosyltransferase family 2 protein [Phocaeicola sp.]
MVENKLLSIIVPTYNMELYLDKCLTSLIMDEKYMDKLEVLIINDGSKDRSSELAHNYQHRFPGTFRVIDKENGNYGSCFNRGLEESKGRFLRLLDADDWFETKGLIVLLDKLENLQSCDVVVTNYSFRFSNGKSKCIAYNGVESDRIMDAAHYDFTKMGNRELIAMHALTYRTIFLKNIELKLQQGISYTDSEYVFFPLLNAKTIVFYDIDLYQYFFGREGQTVSMKGIMEGQNALYRVETRLLNAYLTTSMTEAQQNNCLKLFADGLYHIYCCHLIYKKKEKSCEPFLNIEQMVSKDKCLIKLVMRFTYKKIPFVILWKYLGIKLSLFLGK